MPTYRATVGKRVHRVEATGVIHAARIVAAILDLGPYRIDAFGDTWQIVNKQKVVATFIREEKENGVR